MQTELYNAKGEKVGKVELPENIFGVRFNNALVKQVVDAQLANRRRPWAHAKTRAEVRGGGRKPWRQKGTGRARHGSTRSPLWVGGGKAHGPNKERDYSEKVNKKMRRLAIASVLSERLRSGQLKIVQNFDLGTPKTKVLAENLRAMFEMTKRAKRFDALLVPELGNTNVFRAGSNLVKTKVSGPASLNVYDLLNHNRVLIEEKAIESIKKAYSLK